MTKTYIVLSIILLTACKGQTNKQSKTTEPVDSVGIGANDSNTLGDIDSLQNADPADILFSDYAARIPQIELPFTFSCDSGLVWPKIDYEDNVIEKYKPDGAQILGKLFQNEKSVAFIYTFPADVIYPIIYTYNINGEEQSKLDLFELSDCTSDLGYYSKTRGQITEDFRIISMIELIECDDNEENCDTTRTKSERTIY